MGFVMPWYLVSIRDDDNHYVVLLFFRPLHYRDVGLRRVNRDTKNGSALVN